jgi:hypothetical protein
MNVKRTISVLSFGTLAMFAVTGCGGGPPSEPTDTATATTSEAVASAGYTCTGGACICYGDDDCNGLFGSGLCDGKNDTCWTRGPTQYCTCYPKAAIAPTQAAVLRAAGVTNVAKLAE